jgi:hypothetical protein
MTKLVKKKQDNQKISSNTLKQMTFNEVNNTLLHQQAEELRIKSLIDIYSLTRKELQSLNDGGYVDIAKILLLNNMASIFKTHSRKK